MISPCRLLIRWKRGIIILCVGGKWAAHGTNEWWRLWFCRFRWRGLDSLAHLINQIICELMNIETKFLVLFLFLWKNRRAWIHFIFLQYLCIHRNLFWIHHRTSIFRGHLQQLYLFDLLSLLLFLSRLLSLLLFLFWGLTCTDRIPTTALSVFSTCPSISVDIAIVELILGIATILFL